MNSIYDFGYTNQIGSLDFQNIHILGYNQAYFDSYNFSLYEVTNGQRLESISIDLYNSTLYWDLILFINNMPSPFLLPKSSEIIVNRAIKSFESFCNNTLSQFFIPNLTHNTFQSLMIDVENGNITTSSDALINRMLQIWIESKDSATLQNETYRYVKVVQKADLQNFINLLGLV